LVPGVEVLLLEDGKLPPRTLRPSVGEKRQRLIHLADAPWISFVDDDDLVPVDYVSRVLGIIEGDDPPDVVGFRLRYFVNGARAGEAIHSFDSPKYPTFPGQRGWKRYDRTPNHLNPIRREIACRVGYKPLHFGEDGDYAKRLALVKPRPRETFVDAYLYDYLFIPEKEYAAT
jgi:hypothetical protein